METSGFEIRKWPVLRKPVMVIGLGGWGNALNVAKGAAAFLVRQTKAQRFGFINRDAFYRFDENRPVVTIQDGLMRSVEFSPDGLFAAQIPANHCDLIVVISEEPHLNWERFAFQLFDIVRITETSEFISLGSLYDGVLHTDALISGIAGDLDHLKELDAFGIRPITYHGPSAIHSILHRQACERRVKASSLWTHCPYYLEGSSHPGLIAATAETVARIVGLRIDTRGLNAEWERIKSDIQAAIENNPKLQKIVSELRRAKVRGAWADRPDHGRHGDKVIRLKDFRDLN
jgi:proteasome assembly chaperone (PAC2) family protein